MVSYKFLIGDDYAIHEFSIDSDKTLCGMDIDNECDEPEYSSDRSICWRCNIIAIEIDSKKANKEHGID